MSTWLSQARPDHLGERDVHLWIAPVPLASEKLSLTNPILVSEERERAARFHRSADAQRYVTARKALRILLGAYLAIEPNELVFACNAFGKPYLVGSAAVEVMNFSISHSGDLVLLGFSWGRRLGVDLENVQREVEYEELAKRYFTANEFQTLRSLAPEQRRDAFYCAWTRKEAYLKAQGEGLSHGLDRVQVSLSPNDPPVFTDPAMRERWSLQHLSPAPGYVGAAAVEARDITFNYFIWKPA